MKNYQCKICGKNHDIFRGMREEYPAPYYDIPEEEKESRVKDQGDILIIDKLSSYAFGNILIEMENQEKPFFCWEVWVKLSNESLRQHLEDFATDATVEIDGVLVSKLPFYEKAKGLKVKVYISKGNKAIEIRIDENSPLKEDQAKPITENRMIELMQMIHHNPKREERQNSAQPFKERLLAELEHAQAAYIVNEKDFVIDVSTSTVLFQIIGNTMLDLNRKPAASDCILPLITPTKRA